MVLKWAIKPEQNIYEMKNKPNFRKVEKKIKNADISTTFRKPGDLAYFRDKLLSPSRKK